MRVALHFVLLVAVSFLFGTRANAGLWLVPEPALLEGGEVRVQLVDDGTARAFSDGKGVRLQRTWREGRQNLRMADDGAAHFRVTVPGTQLVTYRDGARFCKAFVIAGRPAEGGQLHLSEVGQRLEIVPQTDPIGLVQGVETFEVQVLFEREPLAAVTVEAVRLGAPAREIVRGRTDEIGLVALRLAGVGSWLVRVRTGRGDDEVASTLFVARRDGW